MSFLRRIFSLFSGRPASDRTLPIYVLNFRCNEPLEGTVDLFNELSMIEDGEYAYYVRKVLHTSGQNRCFGEVEVQLWFNNNKELQHYEVQGGRWLDADEYAEELARFNAPPAEETVENQTGQAGNETVEKATNE
jgi:hypothetical protein